MPEATLLERDHELLSGVRGMNLDPDRLADDLGVLDDRRLPDDIAFLVISRGQANG